MIFLSRKLVIGLSIGEDFVILACVVFTQCQRVMMNGRTSRSQLMQGLHSLLCWRPVKNYHWQTYRRMYWTRATICVSGSRWVQPASVRWASEIAARCSSPMPERHPAHRLQPYYYHLLQQIMTRSRSRRTQRLYIVYADGVEDREGCWLPDIDFLFQQTV